MGIVSSNEIAEQRRGPTFEGDGSLARRYTRVFQVITDSYFTGGLQALIQGTAIPRLYSFYDTRPQGGVEYDPGAILISYDPYIPDNDTPNRWLVRCEYSSKSLDPDKVSLNRAANPSHEGGGDHNENPLLRPARISFRKSGARKTLSKAFGRTSQAGVFSNTDASKLLINSAGQAYNPGPEVDLPTKTMAIVKNRATFDPIDAMSWEGFVNNSPFLGFPKGTVKIDSIDADSTFENGLGFFVVTYTFSVRPADAHQGPGGPWDWEPLDKGTYYLDTNDQPARFSDNAGNPLPDGLLDGSSRKLASGAAPIVHSFRIYGQTDFSGLGLP